MAAGLEGLFGDGSLEARGDAAAEDCAEVWEDWVASLDGHDSVLGVWAADDDSRDGVGREARLASVEPLVLFCDLSMAADAGGGGRWSTGRGMEALRNRHARDSIVSFLAC